MTTRLNPYIMFTGNAREAIEFYSSVFGGELTLSTYGEAGMGDAAQADRIMHAMLVTEGGLCLMASDSPFDPPSSSNISISLSGEDDAELRGYWKALSDGAKIEQPLEIAPWGDAFGSCTDRFGVNWMVNIAGAQPSA